MGKTISEKVAAIKEQFDATMTLSSLTKYVEERKMPLLSKAILQMKTANYLRQQFGVKDSATLNLMDGTTVLQDGKACAWNSAGTNTFTQRKLQTGLIKVQKHFCNKDFWEYYMNEMVKAAANDTELVFEQELVSREMELIQEANEKLLWQGDTTSGDANLAHIDGLVKLFDAASTVIEGNISDATSITESNVIVAMQDMYRSIPGAIIGKVKYFFASSEVFRKYKMAVISANLYHFDPKEYGVDEMPILGTEVVLVRIPGLTGINNRIFAAIWDEQVFLGVDMINDSETVDMWYSQDNRQHRIEVGYNMGVQFAFPDQIVKWSPISTITGALTTPADNGSTNKLVGLGTTKTVTVNVVNTTASVVITGAKTSAQTLTKGGTNAALVTVGGSATVPTLTVNTDAIKTTGGTYTFTIEVTETGKKAVLYTFSVIVAGA